MTPSTLIDVRDLSIRYATAGQPTQAVRSLSFSMAQGETLAIVGASGSGKSTLAHALLGLLPDTARIDHGQLWVDGIDLASAPERIRRQVRGRTVGLVPQDPMVSLNPTLRVGQQVAEALVLARGGRFAGLDTEVQGLLAQVGLDDPALRARQYPHALSGGMRQRVLIAIALAGEPRLIIADEPTSALDVTVQRRILDHLQGLVAERGLSLLIITHDLGMACDRADRLLVMKQGQCVEQATPRQILWGMRQPYTQDLLTAAPAFVPRRRPGAMTDQAPLLRLQGVGKRFVVPGRAEPFTALQGLSFDVQAGQTVALVGESGSGKSTALRLALGLETPSQGQVTFAGVDVGASSWRQFRPLRRRIQLVQQNPFAALDPRFTVFDSIVEPLVSFGLLKGQALARRAQELIAQVHLPVQFLDRLPSELSGGQRQRVAIARALALEPDVLLLDEPVSALDVSVQAQIPALLETLQHRLGMAYVLVSHDLAVVASMADHVVVLRRGQVVEQGPALQVLSQPTSAYTRELIAAIPGHSRRVLPVAI
ncbi:ABC transporter ATP-binding protein [Pseudomonas entomophila]|uniref:dipeptide ABC transporter ATP-binding protein n=1 Tax=Pseudomonas entomophila TaxID=312306 RepID=UPI0015E2E67B|nr:ABC transporter ATP-binding protein [Pseudomonas entomophila]MBA1189599.1 ABC transporter ATP-binding protein [Pseudomonas entomophila]